MNVVWQGKKTKKSRYIIHPRAGSELPGTAGITLQEPHYGRVALGAADELFQRELS